jgi:putative sterol carrier protein
MIAEIFASMEQNFHRDPARGCATYYFSIDQVKRTVTLAPDSCKVEDGKTVESADCVCKLEPELFLKIWQEGYMPGMKDFLSGALKSNDPQMLKAFLQAFGKG